MTHFALYQQISLAVALTGCLATFAAGLVVGRIVGPALMEQYRRVRAEALRWPRTRPFDHEQFARQRAAQQARMPRNTFRHQNQPADPA